MSFTCHPNDCWIRNYFAKQRRPTPAFALAQPHAACASSNCNIFYHTLLLCVANQLLILDS